MFAQAKGYEELRHIPYPETIKAIADYKEAATVEGVVMIDTISFDEGRQWARKSEQVKLTQADADVLSQRKQVVVISRK